MLSVTGGDVEVSPRRVHNSDVVSITELSDCGHSTRGSGAVIAAPRAAMAWLIAAPVAVSQSWVAAALAAPARRCSTRR